MLKNKALENGERATYGGLIDMAWPVHYEYETLRANPVGKANSKPPHMDYDGKILLLRMMKCPVLMTILIFRKQLQEVFM